MKLEVINVIGNSLIVKEIKL